MQKTDLYTILRLPTGIFYAQGVKANVIFFDNKPASKDPWTKEVWIYDFRTNRHFTLKTQQLKYEHLQDFIKCHNPKNRFKRIEADNFKKFTYEEITSRDKINLNIFQLKDESLADMDNLPDPEYIGPRNSRKPRIRIGKLQRDS